MVNSPTRQRANDVAPGGLCEPRPDADVAGGYRPTGPNADFGSNQCCCAVKFYCPLCNGVRLDTCELQACIQMRQVISDKLAEGVSKEQIKQEFVAEYGPKVLGEPPRSGLDLLAWIVPIAAIIAGAAWLLYTARRWSRQPEVVPASAPAAGGTEAETTAATASTDAYLAQVETDLANLE